ncbi:hypothetical protein SS05631_c23980 [Sinorhizobium sp. CCBAU 05631]|nr:hypothetical protein SS05631_c23980 [Sinorhizobium sp. CCBAU 05631]
MGVKLDLLYYLLLYTTALLCPKMDQHAVEPSNGQSSLHFFCKIIRRPARASALLEG